MDVGDRPASALPNKVVRSGRLPNQAEPATSPYGSLPDLSAPLSAISIAAKIVGGVATGSERQDEAGRRSEVASESDGGKGPGPRPSPRSGRVYMSTCVLSMPRARERSEKRPRLDLTARSSHAWAYERACTVPRRSEVKIAAGVGTGSGGQEGGRRRDQGCSDMACRAGPRVSSINGPGLVRARARAPPLGALEPRQPPSPEDPPHTPD
jgi:hypothetical protein